MATIQVNTSLDPEDAANLDRMAAEAGYDNRSAFVRWLIRREWLRKSQSVEQSKAPSAESIPMEIQS